MRVATAADDPPYDPPIQPAVGSLTYLRVDGTTRTFAVRPFLYTPDSWPTKYAGITDALRAARWESHDWMGGVTFGVVKSTDGAFLIRPMESENGIAFPIDGPMLGSIGVRDVQATATDAALVALVGPDRWVDFTDGKPRTDVLPVPLPDGTLATR
jgi:hypothetical protein